MDDGDIASQYADEWLESKLKEHQENQKHLQQVEEGEEYECEECGCILEKHRVPYGLCIDCARWLEEHNKRTKFRGEF